jgi:serine/threonine protein kinase
MDLDTSAPLAPGIVFAREYQIVRKLAEGGMGVVYVALQLGTMKQRALKVMRPAIVKDPRNRERFLLEARAGASLQTDHVVDVIGAGIDEATGAPWLAMELLEGETLAEAVEKRGPIPMRDARECLDQLRHALAAAHAAGLVHRDLKPENLFLATPRRADARFTLKVLDFGIAKTLDGVTAAETKTAAGSPLWMTPEQANAQPVSTATDVWPLGLIAFWMLTGRYYWESPYGSASTLVALLTEILVTPMEAPSARASRSGAASRLPFGFDEWFARCVVREPAQRFRDGGEALRALLDVLDRHLASAQGAELFPTVASQPDAIAASWQPSTPTPRASLPQTVASMTGAQAPVSAPPGVWTPQPNTPWAGANATPQPSAPWSAAANSAPGAVAPWNAQSAGSLATPQYAAPPAGSASRTTRIVAVAVVTALLSGAGVTAWIFHARAPVSANATAAPSAIPPAHSAMNPAPPIAAPSIAPPAPAAVPATPTEQAPAAAAQPTPARPSAPVRARASQPARNASQPMPSVASIGSGNTTSMPAPHPTPASSPSGSRRVPAVSSRTTAIASLCDTADRFEASGNHAAAQQIRASAWNYLRSIESQARTMYAADPGSAEVLRAAAAEERAYLTARLGHP